MTANQMIAKINRIQVQLQNLRDEVDPTVNSSLDPTLTVSNRLSFAINELHYAIAALEEHMAELA